MPDFRHHAGPLPRRHQDAFAIVVRAQELDNSPLPTGRGKGYSEFLPSPQPIPRGPAAVNVRKLPPQHRQENNQQCQAQLLSQAR